jgi:group I intron endonuclease
MIGIYRIINKTNQKSYVGQSINIELRLNQHFRNAFNQNTHTYEYPLSRAIRKYGKDNFETIVLEECDLNTITDREQYWIEYYNTIEDGYNQEPAIGAKRYEDSNFAILTNNEVAQIIDLLKNTNLLMSYIAEEFGVSGSAIEDINKGRRWTQDLDYPIRKSAKSIAHQGEYQNTAILTSEDVLSIRRRYEYESLPEIFEDYKNKISFSGFKKVCYGVTWKHIPCYKKREKIWVYPK